MRVHQLIGGLMAAAVCVSIMGCGKADKGTATPAPASAPIRLTYSVFFPPTHIQSKLAVAWAEEVGRRTGGRVAVEVFAGGVLTKADQNYQGVVDGVSDIGMSAFAYTRGRFPLLEAIDLPLGYPDGVVATRAANALALKYRPQEVQDTQLLYVHAHGPGILASKRPVRSLADLKGMKIRATGFCAKVVERLGAAAVGMPQGETYEALQKGVADATFCPIETLKGWKQGEVIQCVTESQCIGYTTAFYVTMNKEKWAALPADIQKIIEEVSTEWVERHGQAWNEADAEGRTFTEELGRTFIALDAAEQQAWKAQVVPLLEEYVTAASAKGLPAAAFLQDLQAAVAGE